MELKSHLHEEDFLPPIELVFAPKHIAALSLSFSPSLSLTHTHTLSLSLSLSHTHTFSLTLLLRGTRKSIFSITLSLLLSLSLVLSLCYCLVYFSPFVISPSESFLFSSFDFPILLCLYFSIIRFSHLFFIFPIYLSSFLSFFDPVLRFSLVLSFFFNLGVPLNVFAARTIIKIFKVLKLVPRTDNLSINETFNCGSLMISLNRSLKNK